MVTDHDLKMWRRTLDLPTLRHRHISEMAPIIDLLPENAVIAEVGVFAGEATVQFLKSPKVKFVLAVDNWQGGYEEEDVASGADMEVAKFAFNQRMFFSVPWEQGRCQFVVFEGASLHAASTLSAETLDLVYIDARHTFEDIWKDIDAWNRVVKPGGWLSGHDYRVSFSGVVQAVEELVAKYKHLIIFPDTSWAVRKG